MDFSQVDLKDWAIIDSGATSNFLVTEALVMDQKMAELEKQNLENRILVLGAKKPNQFFNTHARVYEKVTAQIQPVLAPSNNQF